MQTYAEMASGVKNLGNVWSVGNLWKDGDWGSARYPPDHFLIFSTILNICWKSSWGRECLEYLKRLGLRASQALSGSCLNLLNHSKHAGDFQHVLTWPAGHRMFRMFAMLEMFEKIGMKGQPAPQSPQTFHTLQTCVDMASGAENVWNSRKD